MRPESLDHVALWVAARDEIAEALADAAGFHLIERTNEFTLLGADARLGKLTLFDADSPRDPGQLLHVALRVPAGSDRELELADGLRVRLVAGETGVADLDHVALRVPDPFASESGWHALGFSSAPPAGDGAIRVGVGGACLELRQGPPSVSAAPLLNHLGLLVSSVEEHHREAERAGLEIEDLVDAPNTLALFVRGPDGVRVEYVEHKPSFSLA